MMEFNDGFIGYPKQFSYEKFSGEDSEEQFELNLKSQSSHWYYRRANITYKRNTFGHRCKNLAEINLDNYILFTGCSHTEGIGVELEKTHAYQIANQMGCDYYNLAVGGTGIDVMIHNLSVWIAKVEQRPKCIVVQWPNLVRFVTKNQHGSLDIVGPWRSGEDETKFMYYGENIDYFRTRKIMADAIINQISKHTKVIHVRMFKEAEDFDEQYVHCGPLDYARDLCHFGIKTHTKLANDILALL